MFWADAGGLAVLAATTVALTGWDWAGLGAGARADFMALAAVMAAVAGRGWAVMRRRAARRRPRFTAAAGFTLIALFTGFVVIGWAVAVAAVAAVLAGRQVIGRTESRAARQQDSQAAARPHELRNAGSRHPASSERIVKPVSE